MMGEMALGLPSPTFWPKTSQQWLGQNHLPGASPCSSIRKGNPPYGWKNRGIFAVGRMGRRGLRVSRNLGQ